MTQSLPEDASRAQWHATDTDEVLQRLATDPEVGLDPSEAATRLSIHGPNRLGEPKRWLRVRRFADQFKDILIWLLVAAAVTSGIILGAWVDATAIAAIVLINAGVGYAQETKAHTALDRLREMEAPEALVNRGGVARGVPSRDLVPGDVLLVEAGDRVPADARVVDAIRLVVDEAPLTGESLPVTKGPEPCAPAALVGDRTSMLHAGTTIVAGRGKAVVTSTGMETEMGRIAALFADERPPTPLQVELVRIGRRLALVAGVAAVLIFGAGIARSFPVESMVLTAVALAVAAIPEGLPAVITVSLAGGLQRMAQRNAIVRRLPAVEALGAVDVICTDKTGTLTAPELEVVEAVLGEGRRGIHLLSGANEQSRWLLASAALCNSAYRSQDGWAGDPTEVALLAAVDRHEPGLAQRLAQQLPRADEAGFDSRRKRMSTLHPFDDGFVLLVKGAPEVVLERSSHALTGDGSRDLDENELESWHTIAENLAAGGMRTLALAMRRLGAMPDDPADEEKDLTFLGMVGLMERVRPEVPSALARAARAGVRTVMVTGDHAVTAEAIADSIGLTDGKVVAGHELSAMSAEVLSESAPEYRVYARVDPADKVKIIEAWQRRGATVAMTGDGVNDSPALHRADIGVAMGSGTDVARESASIVLADDNYASIVAAIAEGRRLFENLRNVVHYLLSANASEVLYVLVGFLAFGFLGEPLLAVQLLWINLVSDALPAIALGMDRPTRDLMLDPPGRGRDVLSPRNLTLLLVQGSILAGASVLVLSVGTFSLGLDHPTVQTMVFTTLVFSQLLHALNVRTAASTAGSLLSNRGQPLLWGALGGSSALHLVVVYTAAGNSFFRTVPLGWVEIATTVAASVLAMALVRVSNRLAARWADTPAPRRGRAST